MRLQDVDQVLAKMEEFLIDHNATSKRPMNLAMFLYAIEHTSRICRVLKQSGSHMLNVGVGGSGRSSLSRLAAFISEMQAFQIEISKSYSTVEWREDLKRFTRTYALSLFAAHDCPVRHNSALQAVWCTVMRAACMQR